LERRVFIFSQCFLSQSFPNLTFAAVQNTDQKHIMFNKRIKIKELLDQQPAHQQVTVMGWVRTFRNNQFIALNDGSTNNNLQVVLELGKFEDEVLKRITTSAALKVSGTIEPSLGKGQKMDLKAASIEILGDSDAE
jgi:asparaginyl-tRNA synthetase